MSGIEVVGLVLGALPLVLEGLKLYHEGAKTAHRYLRYRSELKSLHRRIGVANDVFLNTCGDLLEGILNPEDIEPLLNNPSGGQWNSIELKKRLKKRLGRSYDRYMDTVLSINTSVEGVMRKMKLDDQGNVRFSDKSVFKREHERLRFSISKKDYDTLLADIDRDINALQQLTTQSVKSETSRILRSAGPKLELFRSSAKSVYNILRSSWKCSCKIDHLINLRLGDEESEDDDMGGESTLNTARFRVLFCYDRQSSDGTAAAWQQAEAEVRTSLRIRRDGAEQNQLNKITRTTEPSKVKALRFEAAGIHTSGKLACDEERTIGPEVKLIQDLCNEMILMQAQSTGDPAGFLPDEHANYEHYLYVLKQQSICAPLSLSEVLLKGHPSSQGDRLHLGVVLASNLLRLGETYWLEDSWTKDEIVFLERCGRPVLENPFISKSLVRTKLPASMGLEAAGVQNQALFTLGILLIELFFGKNIDEVCLDAKVDKVLDITSVFPLNWRAMDNLLFYLNNHAGSYYGNAVRVCIRNDIEGPEKSFDNRRFRDGVYAGVVVGLKRTEDFWRGDLS